MHFTFQNMSGTRRSFSWCLL